MEIVAAKFTETFIVCLCLMLAPQGTKEVQVTKVGPDGPSETIKLVKTDKGWDVSSYHGELRKPFGAITADPKKPAVFTMTVGDKQETADLTKVLKLIKLPLDQEKQEIKSEQGKIVLAARDGVVFVTCDGKTTIVHGIVAPRATTQPDKHATSGPITVLDRVTLRDVQGLSGGQTVFIMGNGACGVQVVKPGNGGLQEIRYVFKLTDEQMFKLVAVLEDHDFLTMKPPTRPGLPDEAHPEITVRLLSGRERTVTKWANDKYPDFDVICAFLTDLAKNAKGEPAYTGKFDYKWHPEGFDHPATTKPATTKPADN